MREDSFIWPNLSLEKWQAEGAPKADSILREKTMRLINGLKAPDHHEKVLAAGEAFIRNLKSGWR
jgi:hypothetical protein